jgi:hypothetical protein
MVQYRNGAAQKVKNDFCATLFVLLCMYLKTSKASLCAGHGSSQSLQAAGPPTYRECIFKLFPDDLCAMRVLHATSRRPATIAVWRLQQFVQQLA